MSNQVFIDMDTSSSSPSCCNVRRINGCLPGSVTSGSYKNDSMDISGNDDDDDDNEVVKELNAMTVQEREKILEDIHGVAEIPQEDPSFISLCMQQFDQAIDDLPRSRRQALDKAIFLKPSIMADIPFKLMFLRADNYNARKAACRIAKYYEDKLKLFGESKVAKRITLDDLDENDMASIHSDFLTVLPFRDRSGRPIVFSNLNKFTGYHPESLIRNCWYQGLSMVMEDETAQMKGIVAIIYYPGNQSSRQSIGNFVDTMLRAGYVSSNVPSRITSVHFCYNSVVMKYIQSLIRESLGRDVRLRVRGHYGSDLELQYSLLGFGIMFPRFIANTEDGEMQRREARQHFLDRKRIKDNEYEQHILSVVESRGLVPHPNPNDVLVGRGCPYQTFTGNQLLFNLIDRMFLDRYMQTRDRFGRTCIHMEVMKTMSDLYGSRFLERTLSGWKVADDNTTRKKVCNAFRTRTTKVLP